jgi:hypothetical protein
MGNKLRNVNKYLILFTMTSSIVVLGLSKDFSFSAISMHKFKYLKNLILNSLAIASNPKLDNNPVNAVTGPGLTPVNYTAAEVGTILSENDTNGKAVSAVAMHNGYLFVPMGADHGGGRGDGAFSFYDVSNQKNIKKVFDSRDYPSKYHTSSSFHYVGNWAEVHSVPIIGNRIVIPETSGSSAGIVIFDTSKFYDNDPNTTPDIIGRYLFPGVTNPTNYDGLSFAPAVKGGRYVFAPTGTNGLFVIDIIDPTKPKLVVNIPKVNLSNVNARSAFIMGDLLVLSETNNDDIDSILFMDCTDVANPKILSKRRDFDLGYQGFMYGDEIFGASKNGISSYNISNLSNITVKKYNSNPNNVLDRAEYGFGQDDFLFVGHYPGLTKWDKNNPQNLITRCDPKNDPVNDYAFLTPLGNTAAICSDHGTKSKLNFGVHKSGADKTPPGVRYILPKDNSANVSVNASIGISFSDYIDALSVNVNNVQVRPFGSNIVVEGSFNQNFGFVSFLPNKPLEKNTTYEVTLKGGGIKDWSGNAVVNDIIISKFSTGPEVIDIKPPVINNYACPFSYL